MRESRSRVSSDRSRRSGEGARQRSGGSDPLSRVLIALNVIFTPWAFGTTQTWSTRTAVVLGLLLGVVRVVSRFRDRPGKTGEGMDPLPEAEASSRGRAGAWLAVVDRIMGVATVLVLATTAAAALNARAEYDPVTRMFRYHEAVSWLPQSYNARQTWAAFWQMSALAAVFWSVRDWLRVRPEETSRRMRWLLWLLGINGMLLAAVGIAQRASGTHRLLWVLEPPISKTRDLQFGPWAYRGNAASYFNLVWPVCLGTWLWLQERAHRLGRGWAARFDGPHSLLLGGVLLLAACPAAASNRGGTGVAAGLGMVAVVLLLGARRCRVDRAPRLLAAGAFLLGGAAALAFGFGTLRSRLLTPDSHFPTSLSAGTNDLTLHLRVRMPQALRTNAWYFLGTLSPQDAAIWSPRCLAVGLDGKDGSLYVQLLGGRLTNKVSKIVPGFGTRYLDRSILLSVVRTDDLELLVDGQPVVTEERREGARVPWRSWIGTRYFYRGLGETREFAVVDAAMSPPEIAAIAREPLPRLVEAGREPSPTPVPLDALVPAPGVRASRGGTAAEEGIVLERTSEPGPIVAGLPLPPGLADARSAIRVTLEAAVSGTVESEPSWIGASLAPGAWPSTAELPGPSGEGRKLTLTLRPAAGAASQSLNLALVDDLGDPVEDVPPGRRLVLRNLRVAPHREVVARSFDDSTLRGALAMRLSGRSEIYGNARRMAEDLVWWGGGAGTFGTLYQLYLEPGQKWAGYAHNDWLEFRITFGRLGLGLLGVLLAGIVVYSLAIPRRTPARLVAGCWLLALAGCLVHACFDFPFQIYSVALLFLVVAALLAELPRAMEDPDLAGTGPAPWEAGRDNTRLR